MFCFVILNDIMLYYIMLLCMICDYNISSEECYVHRIHLPACDYFQTCSCLIHPCPYFLNFSSSAVEQAWRLLKHYLAKFTSMNGPIYHKAVATKLLSLSCRLPTWFVNDYKEKNAPELLRIYISFDLLEEAGELAVAYIDAVLGIGKESFGIQVCLFMIV